MTTRFLAPKPILGPMPNGDAEDPPVSRIALEAMRDIRRSIGHPMTDQRAAGIQIRIEAAIQTALDRCQQLGGRRKRY